MIPVDNVKTSRWEPADTYFDQTLISPLLIAWYMLPIYMLMTVYSILEINVLFTIINILSVSLTYLVGRLFDKITVRYGILLDVFDGV